jgi:molybdenum cofactor sulfurtransferase
MKGRTIVKSSRDLVKGTNHPSQEIEAAFADFLQTYPAYESTSLLDELRASDYKRLDELDQIYLDYTGGGLYAESQLRAHMELLRHNVFGNPHSHNPTSLAMTDLVEQARAYVLKFFNASPQEYYVIFTPNASGALKLVGESYPFSPGDHYALLADNHNSVNGIREYAMAKGANLSYIPLTQPELRADMERLASILAQARPGQNNLFAYPAQSNYSGVKHPLEWIARAREKGWDVLVDCAAFVPTNRLDLGRWKPDFVSISFYKIFGYPTGIGCLLARKPALAKLQRPWFAGGTIKIASVKAVGHYLVEGEGAFEDGTVNYLNIPAVEIGLKHIDAIGIETITERVKCLTGWLIDRLLKLQHSNGKPMLHIHGPNNLEARGGTLAIDFYDPHGIPISGSRIEQLAGEVGISVRTGCFCNPGCGETAHELEEPVMRKYFNRARGMSFHELENAIMKEYGKQVSSVRISVGLATNFADVYRFIQFVESLRDRSVDEIGETGFDLSDPRMARDAA